MIAAAQAVIQAANEVSVLGTQILNLSTKTPKNLNTFRTSGNIPNDLSRYFFSWKIR